MRTINPALYERLNQIVSAMGFELIGCEQQPMGRQLVFRVFIDSPQGVSADECSRVSHQVSGLLEVEEAFQGRYVLEVSSPGIDRPLFTLAHFQRYVGEEAKVRLEHPLQDRRQFRGIIQEVEEEAIHLMLPSGEVVLLPFDAIDKANLVGKVTF